MNFESIANFGFAAVVAMFVLYKLDETMNRSAERQAKALEGLARQIRLNTIVIAKFIGKPLEELEREYCADAEIHNQQ